MEQVKNSPLLSAVEAATQLRVHLVSVYRWLEAGKMPGAKLNGVWRIDEEELKKWARGQKAA